MQAILLALGLLAAITAGVEGVNQATGGDLNLSALEKMSVAQVLETVPVRSEPVLPPPAPIMEPVPMMQPAPRAGEPAPMMEPAPVRELMRPAIQGDSAVPPPSIRPIMPPPPDQPGARDFSKERPPMPPVGEEGIRMDGQRPNQPPMPPRQPRNPFPPRENGAEQPRRPMMEGGQGQDQNQGQDQGFEEQQPQVNPQEVKQVLRDINQMERELRRFAAQLRRLKNAGDEQNVVNEMLSSFGAIKTALQNSSSDSEGAMVALEEFRDGEYREKLQALRLKIELPREIQQITKSLARAEKVVAQKAAQSLGLDLNRAKGILAEMRQRLDGINTDYQAGNMENAMEELQNFREGENPMDIENAVFRVREATRQLKRLKNGGAEEMKTRLQEAIRLFNNGEYREARMLFEQRNRAVAPVR